MASQSNDAGATASASILAADLFSVNGLVAVVTGGGSGIGRMMTAALAKNGASKVYILGRRGDILEQAASSIGPNVVPIVCDVSSKESLQKAAASIESEVGYINLLVCNAGIGGPQVKPAEPGMSAADWAAQHLAHSKEEYTKVFDVNVSSVWYTAMSFLKLLELGNQKGNVSQTSQVITTSSIGAFNKTAPGGWAYGQSKIAATLLGKHLAATLPQWNIRSNVIAPGLYPSEMAAPIVELYGGGQGIPKSMVPLQRLGDEQDMAGVILYLASRAGGYCNGTVIVSDGGRIGNFPSTWIG
ncbi:short chain dehydrogenase [Plectosphaerella cucumerina]|uniref:Short chain dehydrogenase n=1 Tax=Plectosphaerella cucumerina TaxID=40658 RepID=A0A8K0X7Y4_9PEZI|nr:short chain dehydrogenase [Plectosphaerella cucumerina]